jgi:hypothetical protein
MSLGTFEKTGFFVRIYIYSGSKLRDMLQCISIVFSVSTSAAVTGA